MCQHESTFDHYDFWETGVDSAAVTRQCLACMHHWKVIGVEFEQAPPERSQVLPDIANWKLQRELYERKLGFL